MATASQVHLSPQNAGVYHTPNISAESATITSRLLQENHERYHMFFNNDGFHNHIAHHLLTIFALGAPPSLIQKAFDDNKGYQRPHFPVDDHIVEDMANGTKFKEFLGQEKYFHDYVVFFEQEIDQKGREAVLNEHVFSRSETAELILTRLFAGFLHPLIHLGFGIEFEQPAIIAEALAQAAIHDNWTAPFLFEAENIAASSKDGATNTLVELIHETRANEKIRFAPRYDDSNKIRDGIFARAGKEMANLAAKWRVTPDRLAEKTAEMINTTMYFAGAAQRPPKQVKFDFYYIHCTNCSTFFSAFLKQPWLSTENKVRLLEWKGRLDLALYASRGSPELLLDEITNYEPKRPEMGWEGIFERVDALEDDGHASKLIRALANGEVACKPHEAEGGDAFPIKGGMWLQLGHMAIDSVEAPGNNWVRNTGFKKAWDGFVDRSKL